MKKTNSNKDWFEKKNINMLLPLIKVKRQANFRISTSPKWHESEHTA